MSNSRKRSALSNKSTEELQEKEKEKVVEIEEVEPEKGEEASPKESITTRSIGGIAKPSTKAKETMVQLPDQPKRTSQVQAKESRKRPISLRKKLARARLIAGDETALEDLKELDDEEEENIGTKLAKMNGHGFSLDRGDDADNDDEEKEEASSLEDGVNNKKRKRVTSLPHKTVVEYTLEAQQTILNDLPKIKSTGRLYWRESKRPSETLLEFMVNQIHPGLFLKYPQNHQMRNMWYSALRETGWRANETNKRAFIRELEYVVSDLMESDPAKVLQFVQNKEENLRLIIQRVHGNPATESDMLWYAAKPWEEAIQKLTIPSANSGSDSGSPRRD